MNILAGFKLYGKNPTNAPISDVIKIIETTGDPLNANTISIETHEIIEIPDDRPSSPSIKLIAFVIPTIQPIVTIVETECKKFVESPNLWKNDMFVISILIPDATTMHAAII